MKKVASGGYLFSETAGIAIEKTLGVLGKNRNHHRKEQETIMNTGRRISDNLLWQVGSVRMVLN